MYERLFINKSVCHCFEITFEKNTSQVFNGMVGSVEMNNYKVTPSVVSDALFIVIKSKSST